MLNSLRIPRRVVFLDACRNTPDDEPPRLRKKSLGTGIPEFGDSAGTWILYSTGLGRVSYESAILGQGIFTYWLLEGLSGAAANRNNIVTFRNLSEYVTRNCDKTAGKYSSAQTPSVDGEHHGDIALTLTSLIEFPPGYRWVDPLLGIEFSYIPSGIFLMGSPIHESWHRDHERQHEVIFDRGFWISAKEITKRQFQSFITDSGYETEAEQKGFSRRGDGSKIQSLTWEDSGEDSNPVVHVSWNDARAFCRWLGRRVNKPIHLATEAQWEYAARAGTSTSTYQGDLREAGRCLAPELSDISWYCGNSEGRAQPVGRKKPNEWGLYDMLGNVAEWVYDAADWDAERKAVVTGSYLEDSSRNPINTIGSGQVIRGCGWGSRARDCRVAHRDVLDPSERNEGLGFRIVRAHR